jgi:hypothetical protein
MMKSMTKTTSILLILTLAVAVQPLLAQSGRGTLTGVVKDATGALVPEPKLLSSTRLMVQRSKQPQLPRAYTEPLS